MRDDILNVNILSQVLRGMDMLEVEVMTFLFLAELPVHRNKILVDSRKDTLDKCLGKLHSEGLIGKRIKMFSLTNKGNQLLIDLKMKVDETKRKIAEQPHH